MDRVLRGEDAYTYVRLDESYDNFASESLRIPQTLNVGPEQAEVGQGANIHGPLEMHVPRGSWHYLTVPEIACPRYRVPPSAVVSSQC